MDRPVPGRLRDQLISVMLERRLSTYDVAAAADVGVNDVRDVLNEDDAPVEAVVLERLTVWLAVPPTD